jgi:hypothetical protein
MMDRLTTQVFSKMYPKQDKEAGAFGKESEAENGPVTEVNQ